MTHPYYCQQEKAKDAFEKVQDAAKKMGVDQPFIDEVCLWDDAYREATPLLHKLGEDPHDNALLKQLKEINDNITEGNRSEDAKEKESERVSGSQWLIPVSFFGPHYKVVLEEYAVLRDDPENQTARNRVSAEKKLIDKLISRHHFPTEWGVMSADDYIRQKSTNTTTTATVAPGTEV
ncbi:hypothetical protein HRG_001476 [Hirsutella rhossiliensis]|uniref:Uncharacterized protein n=1 Tax=Hirsutella rhossiliensis TaxID=111463 RepID=A0A9P8NAR7_9HYPO|nr:uncharacterized protein HRG_01476 [Hirsutella rhossiliensis]KAH0968834.1 hypothetical protein HRG_01476 [Hirsutella rhossiliensis]